MESRVHLALSVLSTIMTETQDEKVNEQPHMTLGTRPLIESRAREGTYAFDALSIGKARIEGAFSNIAYCSFKGKPACLVVIDLDFGYHEGCLFKDAQIRVNIGSESQSDGSEKAEHDVQSVSSPKTVLQFGPRDQYGDIKSSISHVSQEFAGGHIGNEFIKGPEFKFGRRMTLVQESRWQIHGRGDRMPRGQTYTWSVFCNKVARKDVTLDKTFPRKTSVWMVVEHENKRFHADIEVAGRRCGDWRPRFWSGNDQRAVNRKVFEPTSSTKILDIDKLSQIINQRNAAESTRTSDLDLNGCFV